MCKMHGLVDKRCALRNVTLRPSWLYYAYQSGKMPSVERVFGTRVVYHTGKRR